MHLAIRTFTVYLRVLVVFLLVAAIGLILFKNRTFTVKVWFFGLTDPEKAVNVVWVILATAVSSLTLWWIVSLGRGLVHDFRELRREQELALKQQSTQQQVADLDTRQRRVKEQLKQKAGDAPQNNADIGF